jgi:hypothetical protein
MWLSRTIRWFLNLTIGLQRFKFMVAQRDRVSLQLASKFPVHPTRPHRLDLRAAVRSSLFRLQYSTITLMDCISSMSEKRSEAVRNCILMSAASLVSSVCITRTG